MIAPSLGPAAYWDGVLASWESTLPHRLWRAHSDAVNVRLLDRWLPLHGTRMLKTDLFDEAVDRGLIPDIQARCRSVHAVDVSPAVVARAGARYPELMARVADVRELPYPEAHFDAVVSNSTLDHFASHAGIGRGLEEIARTLRPGGTLVLTLDNRANPIVALRTSKLHGPLHRLGVVPYFVGATYGPRGLGALLRATGFDVREVTAVMHCPPQLAAAALGRLRGEPADASRHLRRVMRYEVMERWPTRYLTGHFVAAHAVRC